MKYIYKFLIITLFFTQTNLCAKNYALFIHGFGGDEKSWENSGTINELMNNGIINGYINKKYDESEVTNPSYLENTFISPMNAMSNPSDKWVIIGHSMGGLLARNLEIQLKYNYQINVVGVLTVSTPHQGARVAHASFSTGAKKSGYGAYNPTKIMDDWRYKIDDAFKYKSSTIDLGAALGDFAAAISHLRFPSDGYVCQSCELDKLGGYLEDGWQFAKNYITLADSASAMSLIGTNGSIIKSINAVSTGVAHRSVMGAEMHPVPIRYGSTFSEVLGDKNEDEMKSAYDGIQTYMNWTYNWYNGKYNTLQALLWIQPWWYWEAKYNDNVRKKWDKARIAWDKVDSYWGQAINSYEVTRSYYWGKKLCSEDPSDQRDGTRYDWDVYFAYAPCTGDNDPRQKVYYYIYTADKNDGLIRPKEARWKPTDSWIPTNRFAMHGQNNWYYPDDSGQAPGYNHNELRDYRRKYSPNKGGQSEPWQDIEAWLKDALDIL